LSTRIHEFLSDISLDSLIARREISQISQRQDLIEDHALELN